MTVMYLPFFLFAVTELETQICRQSHGYNNPQFINLSKIMEYLFMKNLFMEDKC